MTANCFVRLGLSLAVIALVSVVFYQLSSRPASAVVPMNFMHMR